MNFKKTIRPHVSLYWFSAFLSGLLMVFFFSSVSNAVDMLGNTAQTETTGLYQNAAQVNLKLGLLSNKKMDVTLRIPAQQAYGFAGKAMSPEQQTAVYSAVDNLKQNISSMIAVDQSLGCKYTVNDIDKFDSQKVQHEEKTPEGQKKRITTEYLVLKADVTLNCGQDLPNKTITLNFSQHFKGIDRVLVDLKSKKKRKFVIDSATGSFTL
jgi:hypothetical protein